MKFHLAAFIGLTWLLDRARPRDPTLVLEELQALRAEVSRTRETVFELEAASGKCVWQLWGQGWLLRLSGLADLVLIYILVAGWWGRRQQTHPSSPASATPALPSGSSVRESVLSESSREDPEGSVSSSTNPARKLGRPTRPSDLKKWQT